MSKTIAHQHGNTIYPWPFWMNGEWHTVKTGKQIKKPAKKFRNQLTVKAGRERMCVESHVIDENTVEFRFFDKRG